VSAVYAVFVAIVIYRDIKPRELPHVFLEAGKTTVMLMFIIANALLFAHVLTTERIPQTIAEAILAAGMTPWMFLLVVNIILLVAGNFMEPTGIILILAPIFFPIATQLGIDPIHLGIIMVVNMEIGMITPPVGLNLFVTSGITGMSIVQVVRAALPWLMILLLFLVMVTYIPQISLFLPELVFD
jgi:C4-dicarboxylate transporter, DctM subunit